MVPSDIPQPSSGPMRLRSSSLNLDFGILGVLRGVRAREHAYQGAHKV